MVLLNPGKASLSAQWRSMSHEADCHARGLKPSGEWRGGR